MKAAVIHSYANPPRFESFDDPTPADDEVLIEVEAAALTMLVRAMSNGTHYAAHGKFPFVPGFDGVGRLSDGQRVYFAFPRVPFGAMAERVVVKHGHYANIPDGIDAAKAAAAANPGMSSWQALSRAGFKKGECVLINGATGVSGRLAIQIAKHLGARRVIATGRSNASVAPLTALGADTVIALDRPDLSEVLVTELPDVDVVLDYLWGAPAERILNASVAPVLHGKSHFRFVQIGNMAGAAIPLNASVLRSAPVTLIGSGLGSAKTTDLVTAASQVLNVLGSANLAIEYAAAPLADVESAWSRDTGNARLVFTITR